MNNQRLKIMFPSMGFEKTRVRREFRNHKHTVCIGGKTFSVDSDLEERYARYLEILKQSGNIIDWNRNGIAFEFRGAVRGPTVYTPDFRIQTGNGEQYHETKGYLEGRDITKYRRMREFYPDVQVHLIMQRMPKRGKMVNRIASARKYCARVASFREVTRGIV